MGKLCLKSKHKGGGGEEEKSGELFSKFRHQPSQKQIQEKTECFRNI